MTRHLHLTFIEQPATSPQRGAGRADHYGSDPEGGAVFPPVEDPEGKAVFPPVEDPEGKAVFPPIEDPTGNHAHLAASATALSVLAATSGGGCCCGCSGAHAATSPTAQAAVAPPGTYSGFVIVRMARGISPDGFESLWDLATATPLPGLRAALELPFTAATGATQPQAPPAARAAIEQALAAEIAAARRPVQAPADDLRPTPPPHLASRPLIELRSRPREWRSKDGAALPPAAVPRDQTLTVLRGLEATTATSAFPPLHSLTAYWRVDLRSFPEQVEQVVARLGELAEVDLAYREREATEAKTKAPGPLPTESALPGFDSDQGYFAEAPLGIGVSALKDQDWGSAGLSVCDLEQGWQPGHKEFTQAAVGSAYFPVHGSNRADAKEDGPPAGHHGTAVLGQLAAAGAVRGAAAAFGRFYFSSHYRGKNDPEFPNFPGSNGHVASAIVNVLPWPNATTLVPVLQAGDVLLLEVQRGLQPTEIDPADFDAIRLAAGLGIVVVEAAGNGGFDLDRLVAPDGRTLDRADGRFRDSGAIFVGAARASLPHDRLPFSNFGSRVDCFSWGEAVTSCGYGDLSGSDPAGIDYYTNTFSGTSSASPVIAGAAALLQSLHQKESGSPMAPRAMRALLSDPATGTRQGPNVGGAIGVMPDLGAITRSQGLVPVVYLRKNLFDDGSPLAPDEEVSGSPDLFAWPVLPPSTVIGGAQLENFAAPGKDLVPGTKVWVRLRNRGITEGNARIQIFASPAATLVTPEHWRKLGQVDAAKDATEKKVQPGDILHVVPSSVALSAPANEVEADHRYALLAVLTENEKQPLPPCPPYFDWAEFRAFLRGPGVAMRNVHRVSAAAASSLLFFFANAPDGPHAFTFEIVQRLPKDAQVTLKAPLGLAAKLRQRQPWIGGSGALLTLPRRPRTFVPHVELAKGYREKASFQVTAMAKAPLADGHSLALRQLWRGEEVGRITWIFWTP